jgi:ABC-type multidrug transport system ATPase subunit
MMREVCDAGGAIFFSTHVLEVAEKLCDKVAIIKSGKLIRSGIMDDEIQVDYLEKTEEENSESSSENEDYPGEDVVEIVNLTGETTTVYKLADGRYMDRIERIFIFDGVDTWTDINGAEWNQAVN